MRFSGILIGSEDPERLVAYYTKLFGDPVWSEGGFTGWQFGPAWITVGLHDKVKGQNAHPGRVIWNLETDDVKGEFQRLKGAGATVIQDPYQPGEMEDGWIATFADPDDNYFQLMTPMDVQQG